MSGPAPRIDGDRLWASIEEMATVGAQPGGGVTRIALTPADVAGRALLRRWASELGCACRTDALGNLFIGRAGREDRPAVGIGSHLDTQPEGGAFDGALGVLAGLEVLRALADAGRDTRAPLELVVWTDEEGARFDVSCIGSSVFAGALASDAALRLTDADGVTLERALAASGEQGVLAPGALRLDSYFELHIEQGPVLEEADVPIGIVEGIFGIRWLEVVVRGAQAHAGTTPMDRRADALHAAADIVRSVRELVPARGDDGRATVCVLGCEPNAGSVVPGRVRLVVDLRHSDEAQLTTMQRRFEGTLRAIAARPGLEIDQRPLWVQPAIAFDRACVELVYDAARREGLRARRMLSGAGHDAGYVAAVAPTAMVFVPCRGGVSHHPAERAEPAHVAAGARVLLEAVIERAGA